MKEVFLIVMGASVALIVVIATSPKYFKIIDCKEAPEYTVDSFLKGRITKEQLENKCHVYYERHD